MKKPFIKRPCDIPWQEQEKIRHEVNTFYQKYKRVSIIIHRSVGLDDKYYIYYLKNLGYDNYIFIERHPNLD